MSRQRIDKRMVLALRRYGASQVEIARSLGCSRQRIHQIENEAVGGDVDDLCREAKRRGKLLLYVPANLRHPFWFMLEQRGRPRKEDRDGNH